MIELPNEGLHPTSRAVRIAAGTSRFAESISERQTQRRAGWAIMWLAPGTRICLGWPNPALATSLALAIAN